jgi:hypothetical protein
VFDVLAIRKGDTEYFTRLFAEKKDGGLSAMLYDLLRLDLKGWHPEADRPDTAALDKQKAHSLKGFEAVFLDCLRGGVIPGIECGASVKVPTDILRLWANRNYRQQEFTQHEVGRLLGKSGLKFSADTIPWRNGPKRGFLIPPLKEARERWNEAKKTKLDWPEEVTTWMVLTPGDLPLDLDGPPPF